jgi:hypothetical protein
VNLTGELFWDRWGILGLRIPGPCGFALPFNPPTAGQNWPILPGCLRIASETDDARWLFLAVADAVLVYVQALILGAGSE